MSDGSKSALATRGRRLLAVTLGVLLALLPTVVPNPYYLHIAVLVLLYVILGLGLNIVVGFAGLLDLGYVAFYAVGAYTYALLNTHWHISFWPTLLIGGALSALMGILLGLPTLRLRGDYLALVTLGLGEIVRLVLENWEQVTNGPRGILSIQAPSVFGTVLLFPKQYYYLILTLAVLTTLFVFHLRHSAIGRILAALRDEETAAQCVGIEPIAWKLFAFATGAFLAGVAGVFFAGWQHFVSPDSFTLTESILILCIVVMGGTGSIPGTIAAAAFLVLLPEALRDFARYRMLIFGLALIVIVIAQEKQRERRLREAIARVLPVMPNTPHKRLSVTPGDVSWWSLPTAAPGEVLLRVADIARRFQGIQAVQSVSFEIGSRQIVGLMGPNGAGKTTLFHCISGVVAPDKGSIEVVSDGGCRRLSCRPHLIVRNGIARTFQDIRLFESMTILDHVLLGANCNQKITFLESFGIFPAPRRRERSNLTFAMKLLEFVGMGDVHRMASALTLAEQRRIGIARALATRPLLLLLDEPAAGLNEGEKESFCLLLQRIRDDLGVSILLIEHDMRNVMMKKMADPYASERTVPLVDRILVLHQGQLVAQGSPNVIQQHSLVRTIYLGEHEHAAGH